MFESHRQKWLKTRRQGSWPTLPISSEADTEDDDVKVKTKVTENKNILDQMSSKCINSKKNKMGNGYYLGYLTERNRCWRKDLEMSLTIQLPCCHAAVLLPVGTATFFFFNWRIIIYNVVLVSAIHQPEWVIGGAYVRSFLNLLPISLPISPSRWSQNSTFELPVTQQILHIVMYIFQCYSLHSSHPLLPALCPQVCSLCLHLCCFPVNRLISTTFLDSIHMR